MVTFTCHIQVKTDKNTLIEDVEDYIDELTDSDFAKAAAIIFDKIDNEKYGVLSWSNSVDFIETLGEFFIVKSWRVICIN